MEGKQGFWKGEKTIPDHNEVSREICAGLWGTLKARQVRVLGCVLGQIHLTGTKTATMLSPWRLASVW